MDLNCFCLIGRRIVHFEIRPTSFKRRVFGTKEIFGDQLATKTDIGYNRVLIEKSSFPPLAGERRVHRSVTKLSFHITCRHIGMSSWGSSSQEERGDTAEVATNVINPST